MCGQGYCNSIGIPACGVMEESKEVVCNCHEIIPVLVLWPRPPRHSILFSSRRSEIFTVLMSACRIL